MFIPLRGNTATNQGTVINYEYNDFVSAILLSGVRNHKNVSRESVKSPDFNILYTLSIEDILFRPIFGLLRIQNGF